MTAISQIEKERETKVSAMFEELGVFFAFSNEQFEKSRKEGVTYVQMPYGMIAPKENAQRIHEAFDRIHNQTQASFKQQVPMEEYILHELWNHECFYTGNYSEILDQIQLYYPECMIQDIRKVFYENNK